MRSGSASFQLYPEFGSWERPESALAEVINAPGDAVGSRFNVNPTWLPYSKSVVSLDQEIALSDSLHGIRRLTLSSIRS